MRVVAIIGIATILGAALVSQDVAGWIVVWQSELPP